MPINPTNLNAFLKPSEAASLLNCSTGTLLNYEKAGHISSIRTMCNHRRYQASEVLAIREKMLNTQVAPQSPPDNRRIDLCLNTSQKLSDDLKKHWDNTTDHICRNKPSNNCICGEHP